MESRPTPTEGPSTSLPGSQYLLSSLSSDERERKRLQKLQTVITRGFGNRLLLSPVELQPGDEVLDCGTGPGSWVLDLASTVPKSIQIVGIDVESGFFPPTPPENVTLRVTSVLDLPKEWTNRFRLTHQRLLMGSLTKDGWPIALQELFRVTKPNGWVELCESGHDITCPQHEDLKGLYILSLLLQATNHETDGPRLLPQWLRAVGFVDVQTVEADLPLGKWAGKDGEDACDCVITTIRQLKPVILKLGGLGIAASEEEYDEVLQDLEQLCNETPGTIFKFYTIYGRKPM